MRTKIQKWGNSLAVRIPRPFAEELGIGRDAEVHVSLADDTLVIRPVRRADVALADLLSQVDDENLHDEVVTDVPVGREVW